MIILDLNAQEAFALALCVVNLLLATAFVAYGLGWERGSRRP